MSILAVVIPIIAVLAIGFFVATGRRRDTGTATEYLSRETRITGAPVKPLHPGVMTGPVERRKFLNRSLVAFTGASTGMFGLGVFSFIWPQPVTGFGADVNMGPIDDLLAQIADNNGFVHRPEARTWITAYPAVALDKARGVYSNAELAGMEAGVVALFQKCPHLGCLVPKCVTSQWFECPCHCSHFNQVGEKRGGPTPRGMDRFAMEVKNGELVVKTGSVIPGPPIGTNTTGQKPEGALCVPAYGIRLDL